MDGFLLCSILLPSFSCLLIFRNPPDEEHALGFSGRGIAGKTFYRWKHKLDANTKKVPDTFSVLQQLAEE